MRSYEHRNYYREYDRYREYERDHAAAHRDQHPRDGGSAPRRDEGRDPGRYADYEHGGYVRDDFRPRGYEPGLHPRHDPGDRRRGAAWDNYDRDAYRPDLLDDRERYGHPRRFEHRERFDAPGAYGAGRRDARHVPYDGREYERRLAAHAPDHDLNDFTRGVYDRGYSDRGRDQARTWIGDQEAGRRPRMEYPEGGRGGEFTRPRERRDNRPWRMGNEYEKGGTLP